MSAKQRSDNSKQNVLLLGMVFAHHATNPRRGQEFRDRVRCEAVRDLGYNVYTLDDKHDDSEIEEHCRAKFTDTRRMKSAMKSNWPDVPVFNFVILDYFFSPVGWARERWCPTFFSDTLPALAADNLLAKDAQIWLPNLPNTTEGLHDSIKQLSKHYKITLASLLDCPKNPLYHGTEQVTGPLLSCPDALTNETQMKPLLDLSPYPFYLLERIGENETGGFVLPKDVPETPKKPTTKRTRKEESTVSPKKKMLHRVAVRGIEN